MLRLAGNKICIDISNVADGCCGDLTARDNSACSSHSSRCCRETRVSREPQQLLLVQVGKKYINMTAKDEAQLQAVCTGAC
jgi:hypothetical protein